MVYTYNGILFSHKKKAIPSFCNNMDQCQLYLNKVEEDNIIKSQRKTYIFHDITGKNINIYKKLNLDFYFTLQIDQLKAKPKAQLWKSKSKVKLSIEEDICDLGIL